MVNFLCRTIYRRAGLRGGIAFALLLSCIAAFGAPSISARLDRNTVGVGESATLSITISDASDASAPNLPSIPNLTINYIGQSSQLQIINNAASSSVTHNFEVIPSTVGNYVIPSVRLQVKGQLLATQPLNFKAVPGAVPTNEKLPAFLKLILPKTQVYIGETMAVEIHLYCQDARDLNMPQLAGDGFTSGNIPQPTQTRTRVGNEIYNLIVFKMPVTATRTGSLKLGPATLNLKLLMGPRDFFGQFTRARQVTLQSEPQTIEVLPLPTANKPPAFNGAIGSFTMDFSAAPTNLAVGDPITLKVRISGRGALDLLSMPEQTDWREFKTYAATSKVESSDPLGLQGEKIFEQVVVPQNSGVTELPPFVFSFFDPETKAYRTLSHPAIPLTVRPTAAMPQPTIYSNGDNSSEQQPSPGIVHIKPQLGTLRVKTEPLLRNPAFWSAQALPPLLWIGALVYRNRKESLANNPRLRRQRAVEKIVADELKKLKTQAAANDSDAFFATTFRMLQEQIGERLDLPSSSITDAVVDEELQRRGLDSNGLNLLRELFQTCNQNRYAPIRNSQQLASFIPKVEEAIAALKRFPG